MEFLILDHCVKAWKREAMDLLVDSTFFQMDLSSLRHWKTTVDNLMTHDKTTFKELMSKLLLHIKSQFFFQNVLLVSSFGPKYQRKI